MGHCDFCGKRAEVHSVKYRQNTGILIMRYTRTFAGQACRSCSRTLFWKTTMHNTLLGWWGMISLVMTPIFLFANFATYLRSLRLAPASVSSKKLLEEDLEYALNLLATKDLETVVDVLSRKTGLPSAEVRTYVQNLALPKAAAVR
jgi:hypothetical protein